MTIQEFLNWIKKELTNQPFCDKMEVKPLILIAFFTIVIILLIKICVPVNIWNNGLCIYCNAPYTTMETVIKGTECVAFRCEMCDILDYVEKFKTF